MPRPLAYLWAGPWSLLGLMLSPFFGRRRIEAGVVICEGAQWPRRLGWDYSAITFGHVVLSVKDVRDVVLAHELVHVRQYERWGPLFVPAYLFASLWSRLRGRSAYFDNAFEVAARAGSGSRGGGEGAG